MKIKSKFIILFTSFAIIPLIIGGILIYFINSKINIEDAKNTLINQEKSVKMSLENLESIMEKIGNEMSYSKNTIDYLNDLNAGKLNPTLEASITSEFKRYQSHYGFYENIALISKDGVGILDATGTLSGKDLSNMNYFTEVKKQKRAYVSQVKESITTKKPIFVISEPVLDNSGELIGVIIQTVDLKLLSKQYIANNKIGETGYLYILQNDGTTVAHPKEDEILKKSAANTDFGKKIISTKKGIIQYNYNGVEKLSAYDYNESLGWIFVATVPISEITKSNITIVKVLLSIALIGGILSVLLAMLISKNVSEPIEKVSQSMNEIAQGDFTIRVNSKGKDEIANMSNKLNDTLNTIGESLGLVKNASLQLGESASTLSTISEEMVASASEVSCSIQEVSQNAASQAGEISNVVSSLVTLTEEIDIVSKKLAEVGENAKDTEVKAVEGESKIYELINIIVAIKQSYDVVLQKVNGLSTTVFEIGKITDIISNISEQTNLLALNASIEAARAGEHGKGFTVVAEEVRKLAEESSSSSKKIIDLVKSITDETQEVIENSNKVGELLEDQAVTANDTIISFEDIISSMKNVPKSIEETKNTLGDTIDGNKIVLEKIQMISSAAQDISAASEEISSSSEELLTSSNEVSRMADRVDKDSAELREKTNLFKVE
ncbi:MAG: methyl-accepting chemotaxis protein [Clostridiaceae bacterium]|nr:methyl-accepting chemotaxis protein [Clostridiaceae bacterium]